MMRSLISGVVLVLVVLPALGQVTLNNPLPEPMPYDFDSGFIGNGAAQSRVVLEELVRIDGAAWLRVYFGEELSLAPGSFLRITSLQDGEVQQLDAAALAAWSRSTAYFNGDTVRVELVAGPQSQGNRLVITQVAWDLGAGVPTGGDCGICGPDDRVSSSVDYAARLLPAGCSATVYNQQSCMVSAGHCVSGGMVLQFKVPLSNPNCSLNQPPVADQFPVVQFAFSNGGVGDDWSVLVMGMNNQGQKPFDRYGVFKPIAATPPATNNSATIWGYGVDFTCTLSQTQQTSSGNVTGVASTFFNHNVDATFGNSGSSLIRNGAEIIGIATHCPCPNWATRIDLAAFASARESLCPASAPQAATLVSANVILGTLISGGVSQLGLSDNNHLVVDSVTNGQRNNALTEVVAQSPLTTVSQLNVRVEFGPADASPVFYSVQIFNFDTSEWDNLQFGTVSTSTDTVIDLEGLTNPNAYVSGSGQIKLRVAQTARVPQTPSGFTKLVDQVLLTVL